MATVQSLKELTRAEHEKHRDIGIVYVKLLLTHDWEYEFSDDSRVYKSGRAERKALEDAALVVDPHFRTWNLLCPFVYTRLTS